MNKTVMMCLGVFLAGLPWARSDTYYVATNGVDTRTGLGGWTNAVATVSNAVFRAQTNTANVVLVSNGVYAIAVPIAITNGITVSGLTDAPAVVDGQGNCQCFSLSHSNAVLTGFTITNGYGKNFAYGGGVVVAYGTVSNCLVTGNKADKHGGGVQLTPGTLVNCIVSGNRSLTNNGGGIVVMNAPGSLISNCAIVGNTANGSGGGINMPYEGSWISDCLISGNVALAAGQMGGGVRTVGSLKQCRIRNNSADIGGGIYCGGGATTYVHAVWNCAIQQNMAWSKGGGIMLESEKLVSIRNCLIGGNLVTNGNGGGIYFMGTTAYTEPNIYDDLINCTIVSNTASLLAGGLYFTDSAKVSRVINCVIYSNMAAGAIANFFNNTGSGGGETNRYYNCCTPVVTNLTPNRGYVTNAPQFVNFAGGDCRVAPGSPCVNAGTNHDWMVGAWELDGHSRLDWGYRRVDIGAYEIVPQGCLLVVR